MLAQVNARLESQRRGRGGAGISGAFGSGGSNNESSGEGAARVAAEAHIRGLAERHGIRIRIVDDDRASALAEIRTLAREHGIRINITGEGGVGSFVNDDDGGGEKRVTVGGLVLGARMGGGNNVGEEGNGGEKGERGVGGESTPPPTLSGLRKRPTRSRSPSPMPRTVVKVCVCVRVRVGGWVFPRRCFMRRYDVC